MSTLTPAPTEIPTLRCEEQLVDFHVGDLRVYGVLHAPADTTCETRPAVGVVLLGGWSGTRVGPHGILTAAARSLAGAGIPALRFDYRGRGDSEGTQHEAHIGTMVEDARTAAGFLRDKTGVGRVMLLGICAGAQVAMGAAPRTAGLAGLILWSPPPFHPDEQPDDADQPAVRPAGSTPAARSGSRRRALLRQYVRKLFDPRAWAKLAGGQLQPRLILKILTGRAVGRSSGSPPRDAAASWAGPKPDEREYEQALPGVAAPALFIYGSADPEAADATEYYTRLRQGRSGETAFYVVQGANHSFYSLEWKSEVVRRTMEWILPLCTESST